MTDDAVPAATPTADDADLLLRLKRVYYQIDDRLFELEIQLLPALGEPDPVLAGRRAELVAAQTLIRAVIAGRDPVLEEMCAGCEDDPAVCGQDREECFHEMAEPESCARCPLDVTP